jgi:hypothetical protein
MLTRLLKTLPKKPLLLVAALKVADRTLRILEPRLAGAVSRPSSAASHAWRFRVGDGARYKPLVVAAGYQVGYRVERLLILRVRELSDDGAGFFGEFAGTFLGALDAMMLVEDL